MEEPELEEGEAYSYNSNSDYGGCIDPDTDLSYIDEKLHNVLGHFQKDFEGGVSAENLGAKFGGYGSFLPTYQRSPVWKPHPKTPTKPQNCTMNMSPNNLTGERVNAPSSTVPKKARPGNASSTRSDSKALSSNDVENPMKLLKSKKSSHVDTSSSRQETEKKKPVIFGEQNSLKLWIKVGPDPLPGEKNAAIYSGLGLDVSPSSSFENSPSESEEMSREPSDSPFGSPTSILMAMTSLPVEDHLLSPLSDDLIRFVGREKALKEKKYSIPSKLVTESSHAMVNGLESKNGEEKPMVEKKIKIAPRKSFPAEANGHIKNKYLDGGTTAAASAKSSIKVFDNSLEANNRNGAVWSEAVGNGDSELWGSTQRKDLGLDENPRTSSAGSVQEDKKTSSLNGASDYSRKSGKRKEKRNSDSARKDLRASMENGDHKPEVEDSSRKLKASQREVQNESRKEQKAQSFSGERKKLKENRSCGVLETRKSVQADKKEAVVALKPPRDARKVEETYKDFFGDMEESDEEEVKGTKKSDKGVNAVSRKLSYPLTESRPKTVQNAAAAPPPPPPILTKSVPDVPLADSNPVFIEDYWVQCDKCQTWRLLPYGILPKDLPGKWMCTMLNWLPGMNNCKFTEDETTQALRALSQVVVPESQAAVLSNSNPAGFRSQFTQGDDFAKKTKKDMKEMSNGVNKRDSQTAETNKKAVVASSRNGSINHSNLVNKSEEKQKGKARVTDHHSDGLGDPRSLKIKRNRDADRESYMLEKKRKTESFLFPERDEECEQGGLSDKKRKPQMLSKRPKEEGASETENSDGREAKRKRKVYKEEEDCKGGNGRLQYSKMEFEHVHNSIPATSSSSKISDSHKARNRIRGGNKGSPVESVSSSPMRISNAVKSASVKKKKEEPHGTHLLAAVLSRRSSDGEDDGGSDRSQTHMKVKYDSHESSVLVPRKLDHPHEEGRQSDDHRHSNGSSLRKSVKGSSSRSKDSKQSLRSDSQDDVKKKHEGKVLRESSKTDGKHCDAERNSEKGNRGNINSEREASQPRPPARCLQGETSVRYSSPKKVDRRDPAGGNSARAENMSNGVVQIARKANSGIEHSPSPLGRDVPSSQAAHNALKEAKDLKHSADRLKNTVSNLEQMELYFLACLKFLHGAFLLETSSNESGRQGDSMVQSMKIYSSTANLCGFCAREYEKSKDMGAAALAYKCMEVAHMRVVNSSHASANRYRNDLQTSLQMVPPGESPSSSASDVDNMNHPVTAGKVGALKGVNSPLAAGNHVISAQNRANLLRLLQFAQDVSLAMDASRKSRIALAASCGNSGEAQQGEGFLSIKRVLDYNFQDMEGFLRLVRLAMKANNH